MDRVDRYRKLLLAAGAVAVCSAGVLAQDAPAAEAVEEAATPLSAEELQFWISNTWMLVATVLVFIMHIGFACLEAGLTRAKNTVNILTKNVAIVAIGCLTYALMGFNLMYPGEDFAGAFFGFAGFGVGTDEAGLTTAYNPAYTYWTDFIFQAMFAATAATIVSGAVAERVKLGPFLVFTTLYVAAIYPLVGMWKWGAGWLDARSFHDFAGSTIVHSVGGWGALAGVIVLGPRLGKYVNGRSNAIMGHNLPLATIGALLLWFGWYGFNGGSVLSADPGAVSLVFVTTTLAAAAGVVIAMTASWTVQKHPDLTMLLNGALAGLVGITAGADVVSPLEAVIIGGVSGGIVVFSVILLDRLRLDDPVGAISVHLVCGIWGTLAVGLFSSNPDHSLLAQATGVLATGALCFPAALLIFIALKLTVGIRVPQDEEIRGLDLSEHGMESYAGFEIFTTQ